MKRVGPTEPWLNPAIIVKESRKALDLSRALFDKGIYVHAIRPPTVPDGTARLRISIMATHTKEDLEKALEVLKNEQALLRD